MSCKFQNKSGLYLGHFDFFPDLVSQLKFNKFPVQVYIKPNFKLIESFNQIWVVFGLYFDFFSKSVSKLDPIQVHIIHKTNLGCIWVILIFSPNRFPN